MIKTTLLILLCYTAAFAQWEKQVTDFTGGIRSIYFFNNDIGWAAGEGDKILRTTDGGVEWQHYQAGKYLNINSLYFANSETGYAAGNYTGSNSNLLKTTDGGVSWEYIGGDQNFDNYSSLSFLNSDTGFASGTSLGNAKIVKTINGGRDWTEVNSPKFGSEPLEITAVKFFNIIEGWAGSNRGLWKTTDGGENWQFYAAPGKVTGIHFTDMGNGWATVNSGNNLLRNYIYQYSNDKWEIKHFTDSADEELFAIQMVGNGGWAAGDYTYRSVNGGEEWVNAVGFETFYTVFFADEKVGWLGGANGSIYKTINGGMTSVEDDKVIKEFKLAQNYPNPFNPATTIEVELREESHIKLSVFNTLGEEIRILAEGIAAPGREYFYFDGTGMPSGIYIYKLETGDKVYHKKMILMK